MLNTTIQTQTATQAGISSSQGEIEARRFQKESLNQPPSKRETVEIAIDFHPDEACELRKFAAENGQTETEFLRAATMDFLRRRGLRSK